MKSKFIYAKKLLWEWIENWRSLQNRAYNKDRMTTSQVGSLQQWLNNSNNNKNCVIFSHWRRIRKKQKKNMDLTTKKTNFQILLLVIRFFFVWVLSLTFSLCFLCMCVCASLFCFCQHSTTAEPKFNFYLFT